MNRKTALGAVLWTLCFVLLTGSAARAQTSPAAGNTNLDPQSWAAQLESLSQWLEQHRERPECTARCYTLERLRLTGTVDALSFELEGTNLTEHPTAVPLFGPPRGVHVAQVTEGNRPASVGFEADHYFLFANPGRFVVRGRIALKEDLALSIPGPLNTFESELSEGRVVEGAELSGLTNATVHFERGGTGRTEPATGPTVFELARAVRVEREIAFEYRLTMRSGKDLGVIELPLRNGERVLEVAGSTGWETRGGALVLPTAGRTAEMTVTGTLPSLGTFQPDPRASHEWLLLESDPEHQITVDGTAKQIDVTRSPIPAAQPSARLFLLARGQRLSVASRELATVEVFATVVSNHERTVVLTAHHDLVSDETMYYENNGVDYLQYKPAGRPIYMATDGRAQRLHRGQGNDLLIPLGTGAHNVRLQTIGRAQIAPIMGWLTVPTPKYSAPTSRMSLVLGLPENIHPVVFAGGDKLTAYADWGDAVALVVALLVAWFAFRRWGSRVLAAIALGGLWVVAPPLFVGILCLAALVFVVWIVGRLVRGFKRTFVTAIIVGAGLLGALLAVVSVSLERSADSFVPMPGAAPAPAEQAAPSRPEASSSYDVDEGEMGRGRRDIAAAEGAGGLAGIVGGLNSRSGTGVALKQGMTPVALPLPGYSTTAFATRELVTDERPFNPRLFYITDMLVIPLFVLWLLTIAALLWMHRDTLRRTTRAFRERLARGPETAVDTTPTEPV